MFAFPCLPWSPSVVLVRCLASGRLPDLVGSSSPGRPGRPDRLPSVLGLRSLSGSCPLVGSSSGSASGSVRDLLPVLPSGSVRALWGLSGSETEPEEAAQNFCYGPEGCRGKSDTGEGRACKIYPAAIYSHKKIIRFIS